MASTSSKRSVLAGAGLCLLALVLFRDALGGEVFFERDIHLIWHPQIEGIVRAVAGGAWPVWDPSPAFGQPLLADPGAQVLYPPTWLNLVVRPWTYYTLFAFGHVLLSALGLLAFLRRQGLSVLASWAGAAAWTLSGPYLSLVDLPHHFAGLSWLPLAFLAADRALASRRSRDVVLLGLVLGLQVLAGSGDACAMTLAALVPYVLLVHVGRGGGRAAAAAAARLGTALGLALAIGAGVWVPTLEAAARSARGALPSEARTFWSVHPAAMVETLLDGVPSALPLDAAARAAVFGGREAFLWWLYLGLPCLALVLGAAFARQRRVSVALVLLLAGSLLLALGRHAPFYDAAVAVLPPLRVLRYPVKAMALAAFGWAALVGVGTDGWRAAPGGRRASQALVAAAAAALAALLAAAALLRSPAPASFLGLALEPTEASRLAPLGRALFVHAALAGVAVVALLLRGRGRPAAFVGVAVAAAVADLAFAHPRPNPTAPLALYTHRPEILAALGGGAFARVYSYDYGEAGSRAGSAAARPDRLERIPAGWSFSAAGALAQQMSLAPQTAGRWGLRQGFDVDYRGLQAEPLAYFTRLPRVVEDRPDDLVRLLRLAAVTHVVALHDFAAGRLRQVGGTAGLFAGPVRVYAVDGSLPRVRVAGGVRVAAGLLDAARVLLDPEFDGAREVLLDEGLPREAPPGFAGSARVTRERADGLRIEAELSHDGYLLVTDSFDEGWKARVDGRDAPVRRADMAFRAVALPAGRHVVEMVYRPRRALAAVLVGLLSLAAAFVLLASRHP